MIKSALVWSSACLFAISGGWLARGFFQSSPRELAPVKTASDLPAFSRTKDNAQLNLELAAMQARLSALEHSRATPNGRDDDAEPSSSAEDSASANTPAPEPAEAPHLAFERAFLASSGLSDWAAQKSGELRSYTEKSGLGAVSRLECRGRLCRLETQHASREKANLFVTRLTLDPRFGGIRYAQVFAQPDARTSVLYLEPAPPAPKPR